MAPDGDRTEERKQRERQSSIMACFLRGDYQSALAAIPGCSTGIHCLLYHLTGLSPDRIISRRGNLQQARLDEVRESVEFLLRCELGEADEAAIEGVLHGVYPDGVSIPARIVFRAFREGAFPGRIQRIARRLNVLQVLREAYPELSFGAERLAELIGGVRLACHIRDMRDIISAAVVLLELVARIGYSDYEGIRLLFLRDHSAYLYCEELTRVINDREGQDWDKLGPQYVEENLQTPSSLVCLAMEPFHFKGFESEAKAVTSILQLDRRIPCLVPPTFNTVVCPTRSTAEEPRHDVLERALRSYIESIDLFHPGEDIRFIVFDDSVAENAKRTREVVHSFGGRVQYVGRAEKEAFLRRLMDEAGADVGEEVRPQFLFNRNFMGLYLRGPYITVDDDSTAQALTLRPDIVRDICTQAGSGSMRIANVIALNESPHLPDLAFTKQIGAGALRSVTADVLSAMNYASIRGGTREADAIVIESDVRNDSDQSALSILRYYAATLDSRVINEGCVYKEMSHSAPHMLRGIPIATFTTASGMKVRRPMPFPSTDLRLRMNDFYLAYLTRLAADKYLFEKSDLALLHGRNARPSRNLAHNCKWEMIGNDLIIASVELTARRLRRESRAEDRGGSGPRFVVRCLDSLLSEIENGTSRDYRSSGNGVIDELCPGGLEGVSLQAFLHHRVENMIATAAKISADLRQRQSGVNHGKAEEVEKVLRDVQGEFYLGSPKPQVQLYSEIRQYLIRELRREITFLTAWNRLNKIRWSQSGLPCGS